MAKWGEGDPRWIVEERADATNVNNWHWTEKNASAWSKEKLRSLLNGFIIEDDAYFVEIKELSKIEGEASANNRKAKLIFFYEWEITGEWKGKLKTSKSSFKGKFEIPNLSDENDASDIDVSVSTTSTDDEAYKVKEFVRIYGQEKIKEQIAVYIKELKEEYSRDMIKPTKTNGPAKPTEQKVAPTENVAKQELSKPVASSSMPLGVKITCKKFTGKTEFKCTASDVYRVFTDPAMVRAFTMSECQVDAVKGGRFSMFGGNVAGEFTELELDEKLGMRWRFKSWPAEHYSNVTITLEQKDDCTLLKMTQTGIPDSDYERTKSGWENYYWQAIKNTFGYGTNLF